MGAGCSTCAGGSVGSVTAQDVTLTLTESLARASSHLYNFPKALAEIITPHNCPPNPTDGPTLIVHDAVGVPQGWAHWQWFVALCVTKEGHGADKEGFVAKTAAKSGSGLQWTEHLRLGEGSAAEWTAKTKLTFFLAQEQSSVYKIVGQASITLKELIAEGDVALLIENANGDPVLCAPRAPHTPLCRSAHSVGGSDPTLSATPPAPRPSSAPNCQRMQTPLQSPCTED